MARWLYGPLLLCAPVPRAAAAPLPAPLLVQTPIAISNGPGHFDFMEVDDANTRLLVAHGSKEALARFALTSGSHPGDKNGWSKRRHHRFKSRQVFRPGRRRQSRCGHRRHDTNDHHWHPPRRPGRCSRFTFGIDSHRDTTPATKPHDMAIDFKTNRHLRNEAFLENTHVTLEVLTVTHSIL
jgi:hypothetical protein